MKDQVLYQRKAATFTKPSRLETGTQRGLHRSITEASRPATKRLWERRQVSWSTGTAGLCALTHQCPTFPKEPDLWLPAHRHPDLVTFKMEKDKQGQDGMEKIRGNSLCLAWGIYGGKREKERVTDRREIYTNQWLSTKGYQHHSPPR